MAMAMSAAMAMVTSVMQTATATVTELRMPTLFNILSNNFDRPAVGNGALNLDNIVV